MRGVLTYLILILIASVPAATQSDPKPELIDEFPASLCSDELRGRIDAFFAAILQQPGSIGSIVVTPDRLAPGRALKYRRIIQNHVVFRGIDPDRVIFSERPLGDSRIQFLIFSKESRPKPIESEPWQISETTLFDASGIYTDPFTRSIIFSAPSDEPCDFGVSFDQFAGVLKTDKTLSAHVLFSSGEGISRTKANSALKIALKHLTDLGISPRRILSRYVGARKHAEMQLWLVPKGGAKPIFRRRAVPN